MILLITKSLACSYAGVISVSDQVVDKDAVNQVIPINFGSSGDCNYLTYSVATSPDPAPGGASVTLIGSGPSLYVTQNGNVDSFAVAVSQRNSAGTPVVYTSFLINPYNEASFEEKSAFCLLNASSCTCSQTCTCSATDFCSSHLYLEPAAQTAFVYQIQDSPIAAEYDLNPFTMHEAQQDYGCPVDAYTLQIDYSAGGFTDSDAISDVSFNPTSLKVSVNVSDGAKASQTWTYRLIYNGVSYADFNPTGCYVQQPASFMTTPTPSLHLVANEVTQTVYTFESFLNSGGAACSALTYSMQGLETWMSWDTTSTSQPKLSVD